MSGYGLERVSDFLTSTQLVLGLLWLGLAVFTVTLLLLMLTRWGQSRPLRKCVVLSLLAHMLLAGYATTVRIIGSGPPPEEEVIRISFVDGPSRSAVGAEEPGRERRPWEELLHDSVPQPEPVDPERQQRDRPTEPKRLTRTEQTNLPSESSLDHLVPDEARPPEPQPSPLVKPARRQSPGKEAEGIEAPAARRREAVGVEVPARPAPDRRTIADDVRTLPVRASGAGVPTALLEQPVPLPRLATPATTPDPASSLSGLTDRLSRPARAEAEKSHAGDAGRLAAAMEKTYEDGEGLGGGEDPGGRAHRPPGQLPDVYRLRVAPDRFSLAQRQGATPQSEAAVKAALRWLAENQKPDGRWDAGDHGAGREFRVAGRDRQKAGIQADTGMTGLALLSFLASGHTHRRGTYRENVRRGLEYLLRAQGRDGNLAGRATPYARMYCHAMATFAVSEAYGMTNDERIEQPVRRAVNYTLSAQDSSGGGFRYNPADPGDTSIIGWQLMALKSAELAGIPTPVRTRNGMIRYLRSVCSGEHGGLASYRAGEQVSRPMTAEALVCWQFLGIPREHPAGNEAGDYLLGELPGKGRVNLYYWYYATLGMYQLQGIHWQKWHEALRRELVARQRKTGPMAGTWDPDTVWGGYGGRVYSTTLATLCLEVYYRFLPLYLEATTAARQAQ